MKCEYESVLEYFTGNKVRGMRHNSEDQGTRYNNGRRILMIAFHYPPILGSSGVHRTLKFSSYLPEFGWQPIVLTVNERAYPKIDKRRLSEIPAGLIIKRAFGLDANQHYSIKGAHPKVLALPDRWVTWWFGGTLAGIRLIRKYNPSFIWSTYPIATAHLIGLGLHTLTGIPWVSDFRDPMTEDEYPRDLMTRRVHGWIESKTVHHCASAVFTAPGALRLYASRYPNVPKSHWVLIENGYDEVDFQQAASMACQRDRSRKVVLVHSGVLYPLERDPSAFFAALRDLRKSGQLDPRTIRIVLRASGNEGHYRRRITEYRIDDIVHIGQALPYREALAEIINADGLLILQSSSCNNQIPAKIYEYIRAGHPIFAMTDPKGNTATFLKGLSVDTVARLDSIDDIKKGLINYITRIREGRIHLPTADEVSRYSRWTKTKQLAQLLDSLSQT